MGSPRRTDYSLGDCLTEPIWVADRQDNLTAAQRIRSPQGDYREIGQVDFQDREVGICVQTNNRRVRDSASPTLSFRFAHLRGRLYTTAGRNREAADELSRAYFAAAELGRSHAAFDAALTLARLHANELADTAAAYEWLAHARSFLDRSDLLDESREARLLTGTGYVQSKDGRLEDAEANLLAALQLFEQKESGSLATLQTIFDLGRLYTAAGRHAEAIPIFESMRDASAAAYGDSHPDVGRAHNNLGYAHLGDGDAERAIEELVRGREILTASIGPSSTNVASAEDGLTLAYLALGRVDEARSAAKRAMAIIREIHGDEHLKLARTIGVLAEVDRSAGDLEAARNGFARAVEMFARTQGSDGSQTDNARVALARVELRLGNASSAEQLAQQVVEHARRRGMQGLDPVRALTLLGQVARDRSEPEDARRHLLEALAVASDRGASHPDVVHIEELLASLPPTGSG